MSASQILDDRDSIIKDRVDSVASPAPLQGARIEKTIFHAELKEAIDNTKLDPFSRRAISLYFICIVGFLNAVSSGAWGRSRAHDAPSRLCCDGRTESSDTTFLGRFRRVAHGRYQRHASVFELLRIQRGRRKHRYR